MTETPTAADRRFDTAEALKAVARFIQNHDLGFTSIEVYPPFAERHGSAISVHVSPSDYPGWIQATENLRDVQMLFEEDQSWFRTFATANVDGHPISLLVFLPVDTFVPAAVA